MVYNKENYKIAFYEVDKIIEAMPINLSKRISKDFIKFLKDNKAKNYNFKFTSKDKLSTVKLTKETKIILSLIYRNYLVSDEKRKELYMQDSKILEKIEKEKSEKYSYENLFKNPKSNNIELQKAENISNSIVEYKKENIITNLFKKIKLWISTKHHKK